MTDSNTTPKGVFDGAEVYKLGYVTNDREAAIERLQNELGIEEFFRFAPSFEAQTADGRTGPANLECAYSVGRDVLVEVLQPIDGLVDAFTRLLDPGAPGTQVVFHHVGLLTPDLAGMRATLAAQNLTPELSAIPGGPIDFTFTQLPGLGHLVEHYWQGPDSMALVNRMRAGS